MLAWCDYGITIPSAGLFSEEDDDDELFGAKPAPNKVPPKQETTKSAPAKQEMAKPVAAKQPIGLFSDSDDDDLFGAPKPNLAKKSNLFGR